MSSRIKPMHPDNLVEGEMYRVRFKDMEDRRHTIHGVFNGMKVSTFPSSLWLIFVSPDGKEDLEIEYKPEVKFLQLQNCVEGEE